MVTTCSVTRFAILQEVGIILSGIERHNHIFCGFLSLNYPRDNMKEPVLLVSMLISFVLIIKSRPVNKIILQWTDAFSG